MLLRCAFCRFAAGGSSRGRRQAPTNSGGRSPAGCRRRTTGVAAAREQEEIMADPRVGASRSRRAPPDRGRHARTPADPGGRRHRGYPQRSPLANARSGPRTASGARSVARRLHAEVGVGRGVATRPRGVRCIRPSWMQEGLDRVLDGVGLLADAVASVARPTGPPANRCTTASSTRRSSRSRPKSSTSKTAQGVVGDVQRRRRRRARPRRVAHAAQQPVGDPGRAAAAAGDLARPVGVDRHVQQAGASAARCARRSSTS